MYKRNGDVAGERHGMSTILRRVPCDKKRPWVEAKCDCGNLFQTDLSRLRNGMTVSCGCYQYRCRVQMKYKHGMSKTKPHKAWSEMRARCYCKTNERYMDYGGRGITVCDDWKDSFKNFYEDMGDPPTPRHTLERLRVNEGYHPLNCVWATQKVQQNNRRDNLRLELHGRTQTFSQWCDEYKTDYKRAYRRYRMGWKLEDALTKPLRYRL